MMCSGDPEDLQVADPLFQAMGTEIHIVRGGAGMGSTVKMVHQLLAGVHIAVAAEALALAAKAGLDVRQLYDIVKGAAGNSWMFGDRGKRMIEYTGEDGEKVMSSLAIFIKDMDIVYSSAKALKCPVPIATAALQQYIGGSGLGLDRKDDSQVVKVYETLSGASVSGTACSQKETDGSTTYAANDEAKSGNKVGDVWTFPDGAKETIVDCFDEPHHHSVISNSYTRVCKARIAPNDATKAHRHAKSSVYFFLSEKGVDFENYVRGSSGPVCDRVDFGEVRYGDHSEEAPLIHKLTNKSSSETTEADDNDLVCIDAEILSSPPLMGPKREPLVADHHELIKTREDCRVYKLTLEPNETAVASYPFFYLGVVLKGSTLRNAIAGTSECPDVAWETDCKTGDVEWNSPSAGVAITNKGDTVYERYIVEWC